MLTVKYKLVYDKKIPKIETSWFAYLFVGWVDINVQDIVRWLVEYIVCATKSDGQSFIVHEQPLLLAILRHKPPDGLARGIISVFHFHIQLGPVRMLNSI